jgi:hypothetical protein
MPTTRTGLAVLTLLAVAGLSAGCRGSGSAGTGSAATGSAATGSPSSNRPGAAASSAPSPSLGDLTPGLDTYTDRGDGCAQAISAIGYLDESLRPLGQEPYQEFDDSVRSKLSAVSGTLALEADDWPNVAIHRQAEVVRPLATRAAAITPDDPASQRTRVRTLLRYRIEAARLLRDGVGEARFVFLYRNPAPPRPAPTKASASPTGAPAPTRAGIKLPSSPATERPTSP